MTRDEIRSARTLRKLSQAALGKLTNLSASEISRIECGYRDLSETEAAAIATALGCAPKIAPIVLESPKPAPMGLARVRKPNTESPSASTMPSMPTAPTNPPAAKPTPVGSDLSDPANFGILPDLSLLTTGTPDAVAFRSRLSAEIARANSILHTPRVPAAVWRAWRQFEQQATERLRSDAPPVPPAPPAKTVEIKRAAEAPVASGVPGSKSINSLFVEAARSLVPAQLVERINRAAEAARQSDPTVGFMKHFRRIADGELEPALLKQVTEEANQRLASPERWRARRGRGPSSAAA
jgi:transcriptional regulator with XRE-family HTH domain